MLPILHCLTLYHLIKTPKKIKKYRKEGLLGV